MSIPPNNVFVDSYGFTRGEEEDFKSYEEFMAKYSQIVNHRSQRWSSLLSENLPDKTSRKFKRFIRKGIPPEHRPSVWMLISGAGAKLNKHKDHYKDILSQQHNPQLVEVIKNDIHRTFPDNIYFRSEQDEDPNCKRSSLFNVLLAVSHKNNVIGYCQGMNFVSGLLLLIVKDEEKVFWLVDTLLNDILQNYYSVDMMGVKVDCEVLRRLIKMKYPEIFTLTESLGCSWPLVATKWFICLFVDVLPVETVLRLWDCLFFEGDKILLRVCLTLIKRNQNKILKCINFSQLLEVLKGMTNDPITLNCHEFIESIFKEPGTLSKTLIEKLRNESELEVKLQ